VKKQGWIWASGVTLAVYVLYVHFQPTYSYLLLDSRYDAHKYAAAYEYFRGIRAEYSLPFPFNTRILIPWLATQLPFNDPKESFIWLNGLWSVLTVGVLTFIWQRLQIRLSLIVIALFWILFHWKGLVRMYLPDPLTADVGGYFLQTSFLCLLFVAGEGIRVRLKNWDKVIISVFWISVAVLGTLQKESFIAVVGVTVFWGWLSFSSKTDVYGMTKERLWVLSAGFLFALFAYYLVSYFFPAATSDWRNNPLISFFRGMKRYALQPALFLRIPVSWFLAYGTLWLAMFPIRFSSTNPDVISPKPFDSLLVTHLCLWLILSVFGGGDTTRILFNGMPFVLTFLLWRLNQQPVWVGGYVFLTSLPLMRLAKLEPDLGLYPNESLRWCVECWTLSESWGYWVYAGVVLAGYYYLLRRFGTIGSRKTKQI
jgi:hypothetical protein